MYVAYGFFSPPLGHARVSISFAPFRAHTVRRKAFRSHINARTGRDLINIVIITRTNVRLATAREKKTIVFVLVRVRIWPPPDVSAFGWEKNRFLMKKK